MSYKKDTEKLDMAKTNEMLAVLPDYVSAYIRSIEFTTTPKTRLEYCKNIDAFLEYVGDQSNSFKGTITTALLGELDREYFEEYLHYLRIYEKEGKTYSNSDVSIKRKLSALRSFFTYLYDTDRIKSNPITKIKPPKIRSKEIIRMDKEETKEFVSAVKGGNGMTKMQELYHSLQSDRDLAIVYLILSTGIRVSECVGLNIKDLDMKNKCIHIVRKGGNEDVVWFSDEASVYIQEYLKKRKRTETKDPEEPALFLSSQKQRISVRAVEKLVKKYAAISVPMKKISPHKLRATYATDLYKSTGDIYLTGTILGHKDINTTLKHYAALSEDQKRDARNKVTIEE